MEHYLHLTGTTKQEIIMHKKNYDLSVSCFLSVSAFFLLLSTNTEVSSSPFLFNQREKLKIQTTARSVNFPKCVIFTQVGPLTSKLWLHLLELRHQRTWSPHHHHHLSSLWRRLLFFAQQRAVAVMTTKGPTRYRVQRDQLSTVHLEAAVGGRLSAWSYQPQRNNGW